MVANGDHGIICLQNKDLDIVDDDVADNMMGIEHKIGYHYRDLRLLMMMLESLLKWMLVLYYHLLLGLLMLLM